MYVGDKDSFGALFPISIIKRDALLEKDRDLMAFRFLSIFLKDKCLSTIQTMKSQPGESVIGL